MSGRYKHGTGQYRLNQAKGLAALILENVNRIEYMWNLSKHNSIDEEIADEEIRGLIDATDMTWKSLESHLKYREDLNLKNRESK